MSTSIFWSLGLAITGGIIYWIYLSIKAAKDPDVTIASKLRMSISNYRIYERLYDAHWDVMMKFGPNSSEAEKFFAKEVFPNIPNPKEWQRYQEYRRLLQQKEQEEEIRRMFSK